jgi:AcrR family transcriptional regulator
LISKAATTRERLIGATEGLMCEGGLAAVTTQNVARTCGVAEGTIYRHFESREELIVTVLRERLRGEFQAPVQALAKRAGQGDLKEGLDAFIAAVLPIFALLAPIAGMLAADPVLAAKNAEALRAEGKSPSHLLSQLAAYVREEQRLGRIAPEVDAGAAAGLMVGLCFYRGLMKHLFGEDPTGLSDAAAPGAVATILAHGLQDPRIPKPQSKKMRRAAGTPARAVSRTAKLKRG